MFDLQKWWAAASHNMGYIRNLERANIELGQTVVRLQG